MKFSVIIPAYNAEKHIYPALDSVQSQAFKDYELIVVCDSCTDKTEQIASKYTDKVLRIWEHNDGMARNAGLDAAQGDWILFLDDDDWFLHEYVFSLLAWRTGTTMADVICFSFIFKGRGYARPLGNAGGIWPAVWTKCYRREAIGDTRFPNIYSVSDSYFTGELFSKELKVDIWDMPMVYYNYLRPGSISAKDVM
jgi:glycosyltransferase involved in cell wall biosynthesis